MSRLKLISPDSATGKAKDLLGAVNAKLGMVPNMTRAMANAPTVLEGYLQLSGSLSHGVLSPKVREQLALAISETNGCDYCVAAHSAVGKMVGLTADQIRDSRLGTAIDSKIEALLRFAHKVVEARGRVTNGDLDEVRDAGFDDGAVAEVVAHVALNVFTNYFNNVAETDLDFPKAASLTIESAETA
ncbi:MAG: peroxidase [Pirellula sp.]|nr:peroxidase [Pirellula sp.]